MPVFLCETIRQNILYHIGLLDKAQAHPPQRIADNLWSMTYYSDAPNLPFSLWSQIKSNCMIWREIGGSKLVLISPPPPTNTVVKMIAELGEISLVVSPGNGHDMHAHKWSELIEGCQASCFKELDHEPELKEWGRRVDVYSEDVLAPLGIRWHIVPPGVFAGGKGIKGKNSLRKPFKEAIIQLPIQDADRPDTYALVFQDTMQNSRCIRKQSNPLIAAYQVLLLRLYGLYGFRVTRLFQTAFVGDARLLKEFILQRLCTLQNISMLLPLHGPPITGPGVLDTLKEAVSNLR